MESAPSSNLKAYDAWSEENLKEVIDLWQLGEDAEQLLRRLQGQVADVQHEWNDPHVLVRYMYAPKGYKEAETQFRKMIQWRRDNNVDTILQTYKPNPLLLDYASPLAILKDCDRDGDPIYLERGGVMDGQGLLKRFSQQELMKHAIWLREVQSSGEWVEHYERQKGRCIKDITVVYDLDGLNMRHYNPSVLAWFQSHMAMTEDYYPGSIKRIIVIRAPAIFRMVWNIVKHFFPKCARDKMVFAGPNQHMEVLSRYIDENNLPPCINPNGQGGPAIGMPEHCFGAGRIPAHVGTGGQGYVSKHHTWAYPNLKKPPPMVKKTSIGGSTHTASTDSNLSLDEGEYSTSGAWEEVIYAEGYDQCTWVHVLWEEMTGVEITHNYVHKNRSILFI